MKISEIKSLGEPDYYLIRRPLTEGKRSKKERGHLSIPHLHHTDPKHEEMSDKLRQLEQDDPVLFNKVMNWD